NQTPERYQHSQGDQQELTTPTASGGGNLPELTSCVQPPKTSFMIRQASLLWRKNFLSHDIRGRSINVLNSHAKPDINCILAVSSGHPARGLDRTALSVLAAKAIREN